MATRRRDIQRGLVLICSLLIEKVYRIMNHKNTKSTKILCVLCVFVVMLPGCSHQPEAEDDEAVAGVEIVAKRRPAGRRGEVPATATPHPVRARTRACWICLI